MRTRVVCAVLAPLLLSGLLSGCSEEPEPVLAPPLDVPTSAAPTYDDSLEPAAAVLSVIPASATRVAVTDYDEVRLDLEATDVDGSSPPARRAALRRAITTDTAQLTGGILVPDAALLEQDYGITQDDVAWEALFTGPDGSGYVVRFRDELALGGVTRAVRDGAGPFAGADFYSSTRIAAVGITTDPYTSLRSDPDVAALVGQIAQSTYLEVGCLPVDTAFGPDVADQLAAATAADLDGLEDLDAYSVSYGSDLATVQLGADRVDAFDRARLAETMPATDPEFGLGFSDPVVADPRTGRIGYSIGDPVVAAQLALDQQLPFAVCGP